jgi:predicted acylesterase/phospholipase RssA
VSVAGIGVALSGGGHRASLFGLGALLYLADSGKSREVTSIASVSGGSLTNGFVAQEAARAGTDFSRMSPQEFRAVAATLAAQVARGGTLWATPLTRLYVVLLALVGLAVVVGTWFLPWPGWARVVAFFAGLLVLAWLGSLRGDVCGRALARTLFSPDGRPTRLDALPQGIDHVICATDLHSGEHVYFSGRFVCSYRYGWGVPGDLPLHAAVQASAALPGGFPPRWMPAARHQFRSGADPRAGSAPLVLADGGVYDNMGDQWAQGVGERNRRWEELRPGLHEPDELVVVNSSAPMDWESTAALRLPLIGEFLSLKRDQGILYDNGTSVRRGAMIAAFRRAEEKGEGLRGAIVQIDRSPLVVARAYAGRGDAAAARARDVIELMGPDEAAWDAARRASMDVKTHLSRMRVAEAAGLLRHGYALAMANLHVLLDCPLIELPSRDWFEALVEGRSTPG